MNELPNTRNASAGEDGLGEVAEAARLAFIYGFPIYEMARLRYRAFTKGDSPARPNIFRHGRQLIFPGNNRTTSNNVDTLYSGAWVDLSRGSLLIHMPKIEGRYYSLQLLDFFTNNFAVLGARTPDSHDFLLAGPQWNGRTPAGTKLIRSPTNAVWAMLRILVDDPDDVPAVCKLQDQFSITPGPGRVRKSVRGGLDPLSMPVLPLERTDRLKFFDVLNALLTENPPPPQDSEVLKRLRPIGVGPSLTFDRDRFTASELEEIYKGMAAAARAMRLPMFANAGGWSRPPADMGVFGTNYPWRARCALVGIGALPREEAMYFTTFCDASGAPLRGGNRYVINFEPGNQPPADAFWSLTVYRRDEQMRRWLVPNPINRYSIGDRTPHLRYSDDGSLRIFVQHMRPVANQENWLPAPPGPFLLTLRTYWPRPELLDERYTIPLPTARAPAQQPFTGRSARAAPAPTRAPAGAPTAVWNRTKPPARS